MLALIDLRLASFLLQRRATCPGNSAARSGLGNEVLYTDMYAGQSDLGNLLVQIFFLGNSRIVDS